MADRRKLIGVSGVQAFVIALIALFAPLPVLVRLPVLEPAAASDSLGQRGDPLPAATRIEGPSEARAVYGYLASGEAFDAYVFTAPEEAVVRIAIFVPEGSRAGRPQLSLLDGGGGRMVEPGSAPAATSDRMLEPLTLQTMRCGGRSPVRLRRGNTYYLRVAPGDDAYGGPYVVTFTGHSDFSLPQRAGAAVALPRIWLGLYGQSPFRPRAAGRLALAAAVCVAAAGCAWLGRRSCDPGSPRRTRTRVPG